MLLSNVSNVFIVLNSAANLVVYSLCSRNFRVAFCRLFTLGRLREWRRGRQRGFTSLVRAAANTAPAVVGVKLLHVQEGGEQRGRWEWNWRK